MAGSSLVVECPEVPLLPCYGSHQKHAGRKNEQLSVHLWSWQPVCDSRRTAVGHAGVSSSQGALIRRDDCATTSLTTKAGRSCVSLHQCLLLADACQKSNRMSLAQVRRKYEIARLSSWSLSEGKLRTRNLKSLTSEYIALGLC